MAKLYIQWLILLVLSQNAVGSEPPLVGAVVGNFQGAVRQQLVGLEWRSDQQDWQALRAEVEAPIAAIARSTLEPQYIRGRALEVLTHLPGPLAQAVFQELIEQDENRVLRRRAVDCLCELPLETASTERLLPLLESADRHLGVRVARCLATAVAPSLAITTSIQRYVAAAEAWQIQSAGLQRASK